jgi:hypothetical protein
MAAGIDAQVLADFPVAALCGARVPTDAAERIPDDGQRDDRRLPP